MARSFGKASGEADPTMIEDLLHSCAYAPVARAALASIGGAFAEEVRRFAESRDMAAGVFAARAVIRYGRRATDESLFDLARLMQGSDQPVLAGLREILAQAIGERDADGSGSRESSPPPRSRASERPRLSL
ncbi:MAG: hypothetical protein IPL88_11270 [Rhizobiales bacterium]|nr:hypothetical protein [Hyphomicrobiales bacterium]